MHQMWQLWTGAVPASECDDIVSRLQELPVIPAKVGFEDPTTTNQIRSSDVRWVDPYHHVGIRDLLWRFASIANRNAFQFDINGINDIQFTEYHAKDNGKYDWHHDVWWSNPQPFDRKISIVIQLSDPSEYEGGRFEFDPEYPQMQPELFLPKGSVVAFPSFFKHKVSQVTKGTRRSLVTWVEGPKFR